MTDTAAPPERRFLLVPMLDFPREFEDETNLWFDWDHVPERLSCDGILSCERFQLADVEPAGWQPCQRGTKYLNFYDLASLDVLESEAYALQREMNEGRGTAWRQLREARQRAAAQPSPSRMLRTSWRRRPDTWSSSLPVAPRGPRSILVLLRERSGDLTDVVDAYVDDVLAPEILRLPGFLGFERYEAAGDLASSSQSAYMDVLEIGSPEVVASGTYRRFLRTLDADADVQRALVPTAKGVYVQRPSPWLVSLR